MFHIDTCISSTAFYKLIFNVKSVILQGFLKPRSARKGARCRQLSRFFLIRYILALIARIDMEELWNNIKLIKFLPQ